MLSKLAKRREGFTLIELLIVVAIIGIIAAIAVPQLLNAIQRAKQKRTMADMRSIGEALEIYQIDYNKYINGDYTSAVRQYLDPDYMRNPPQWDAWNTPYNYVTDSLQQEYSLRSYGRDGAQTTTSGGPITHSFDDDIIFSMGQFTQWPEGVQR